MEELLEKIKAIQPWKRFLVITIIIGSVIGYFMMDQINILEQERQKIESKKLMTTTKMQEAISKKNKLEDVKKQLANIKEDLEKAKKIIPDNINIDEILQHLSTYAKETNVLINSFKPEEEKLIKSGVEYYEVPVALSVEGKFHDIILFYDKILHMSYISNLHDLSFISTTQNVAKQGNNAALEIIVNSTSKLILFKTQKTG